MTEKEIDELELGEGSKDASGNVVWYSVVNASGKEQNARINREGFHGGKRWSFTCHGHPRPTASFPPDEDSSFASAREALDRLKKWLRAHELQ